MSDEDRREVLLSAAADLKDGMRELSNKFAEVEIFAKETRKITSDHDKTNRRIAVMIAVLVLVIGALAVTTVRANRANDKATRTQEYQYANCELSNETRTQNTKLWEQITVLLLAPQPDRPEPSKALVKFTKDLKAQVGKTFQLRDCSQVGEGKTG